MFCFWRCRSPPVLLMACAMVMGGGAISSASSIASQTTTRGAWAGSIHHYPSSATPPGAAVTVFRSRSLRRELWLRGGHSEEARPSPAEKPQKKEKGRVVLDNETEHECVLEVESVEATATTRGGGTGSTVSVRWPMFSAFLYFLAMAFTIAGLPRVINHMLTGSNMVTAASATVYGLLSSTDAAFTLLTVNFHATLSDKYGRRPFMALSALGLGTGFLITYHSTKVWMLIVAATIDGCTSCMYSLAQACITDCIGKGPGLSEAFGLFQGVSLGMAFMIGLPLGGYLSSKYDRRFPLLLSAGVCAVNFLFVTFLMPETLQKENRKQKVDMAQANPLGVVRMATRNHLIFGIVACWMLMWVAHVGLQINWINYTDRKFEWGMAQSGASLALMGFLVGVFPKLIIPRLGLERSITYGLLVYVCSQFVIAAAPGVKNEFADFGTPMVVTGLVLASAGSVVFPATLALLSNQVGDEEKGAVQGAADTAKTICSVLFGPAMTWIFGYYIGKDAYPMQIEGASYYVGGVVAFMAWIMARRTFARHRNLDRSLPPGFATEALF